MESHFGVILTLFNSDLRRGRSSPFAVVTGVFATRRGDYRKLLELTGWAQAPPGEKLGAVHGGARVERCMSGAVAGLVRLISRTSFTQGDNNNGVITES